MSFRVKAALLLLFVLLPFAAQAQSGYKVVKTCGTVPLPYPVGSTQIPTIDENGNTCTGGSGGGPAPGAGAQPYNYTPLTPDQHNLAITVSTALTVPPTALQAVVCVRGNNVNYTYDGTTTPTASVGLPLANGQCIQFSGATVLSNLRFIQTAATATIDVGYTK